MYTTLQKDYYRINGKWKKSFGLRDLYNPNFRFIYFFRKASLATSIMRVLYKLILHRYQVKYGFQIYPGTQIGDGFYLGHWGTVVINPKAVIGKNCNIANGVTIGQTNRGEKKGVPTIGDKVWIGANAVIVGNIKIGNNVLIAPNAYVTTDVPDNSIVSGNPATITENKQATEAYINNTVD